MSDFDSGKNYYEILGLKEDCSTEEIRRAYKKLALKWHPDKNVDKKEEAEKKFKEISEAYTVLSDASKKREYDDFRKYGRMGMGGFSGAPGDFRTTFNFNFDNFDARNVFKEFFGGKDPFEQFRNFGFDHDNDSMFGNFRTSFEDDDFFGGMGTSGFMFNNMTGANSNINLGSSVSGGNVAPRSSGGAKKTSIKKTTQTINGRRVTRIEKTITDENGNSIVEVTEEYQN